MAGRPAPRTWQNRHIVTYEDLQEEIHDWHVNDALGLATNAGEEFAAAGRRELRVQAPPSEPSVKFHSGVAGTVAEWKPQSEISSSSSGVVGQGYYKDIGVGANAGAGLGQGRVKLYAGNGRASAYNTVTRMVFNDEMGSMLSSGDPSDFVDAGTVFDSLSVGDLLLLTSDQEVGDIARYRITSIMSTNTYYDVNVSNVSNVGTMGSTGRTWRVQAIKRSVVNAADVFGIGTQQLTPIADNTHILVEDDDKFKWVARSAVVAKERADRISAVNAEVIARNSAISSSLSTLDWYHDTGTGEFDWKNVVTNLPSRFVVMGYGFVASVSNPSISASQGVIGIPYITGGRTLGTSTWSGGGFASRTRTLSARISNNNLQIRLTGHVNDTDVSYGYYFILLTGNKP